MNDRTVFLSCYVLLFVFSALRITEAAQLHPRIHTIPKGTKSVNGSRADGGCKIKVQNHFCHADNESFLIDGDNPVINTTDSDWASELVTMRKRNGTLAIPYDHVVLAFLFDSLVSLTSIRLSLFQCPQWGIGAPNITVYADMGKGGSILNFDIKNHNIILLAQTQDNQSSCNDLVPVTIPVGTNTQYKIWYIVASFEHHPDIDWIYVGEVQFLNTPPQPSLSIISKHTISSTKYTATTTAKPTTEMAPAVQVHSRIHTIPKGTKSVNGSRVDGGCKIKVQNHFCSYGNESFLTDGDNPEINTTDPNWASKLVTMRKRNGTVNIPYDHVVLAFIFQPPLSLTSITLSLFQCPQWGIGAPNIILYADMGEGGILPNLDIEDRNAIILLAQTQDNQSSCNDLVPVTILVGTNTQYKIWYIVMSFEHHPDIDWVNVGEVQFIGTPPQPPPSIFSKQTISSKYTATTTTTPTTEMAPGDSSPAFAVVVGAVVGGTVCAVTVLLLLLLVIIILILVYKKRTSPIKNEKEDPFYDYVVPPHMPAMPLSGDSVQLKENTAYNTTEAVTSPQVQPNIAYGTILK